MFITHSRGNKRFPYFTIVIKLRIELEVRCMQAIHTPIFTNFEMFYIATFARNHANQIGILSF